jgi:hypothetical protein
VQAACNIAPAQVKLFSCDTSLVLLSCDSQPTLLAPIQEQRVPGPSAGSIMQSQRLALLLTTFWQSAKLTPTAYGQLFGFDSLEEHHLLWTISWNR